MNISDIFIKDFLSSFFGNEIQSIYINAYYEDENDEPSIILNRDEKNIIFIDENDEYMFHDYKYKIICGATKIVFIFSDFNNVIKIPFNGEFTTIYEDEDEEITKFIYDDFHNYIDVENQIYAEANESLKKILLNNKFIMNFGKVKVYLQEKISKTYLEQYENIKEVDRLVNFEESIRKRITSIVCNRIKKVDNKKIFPLPKEGFLGDILINFPKEGEDIITNINFYDLHDNNYGYLKNNYPVIFDYSGFSIE